MTGNECYDFVICIGHSTKCISIPSPLVKYLDSQIYYKT